jgi:pimeloyl-ACP methyl ester carboxylesterase
MFFESRGHTIHYDIQGSGPPLVLIHGTPMWGGLWRERGYVKRLSSEFTVITPDLLGFGKSDKPCDPTAYGMDHMAGDVVALLDEIGQPTAHVWGYSMGAWVAEATAVLHPMRIVSVVFGGNVPGLSTELRAFVGRPTADAAGRGDWDAILVDGLPEEARQAYIQNNDLGAISAAATSYEAWGCSTDDLKASGVPTLVYVGDHEWFADLAKSSAAAAGASFGSVPGDHREAFAFSENAIEIAMPHLRLN